MTDYTNIVWARPTPHTIKDSDRPSLEKLISTLEDLEEVQSVGTNLAFIVPSQGDQEQSSLN